MELNQYQKKSWETAIYPNKGKDIIYPALGLGGELGELQEKISKILRDKNLKISEEDRKELAHDLGGILWYIAALATELKLNLNEVAEKNISELNSRKENGTLLRR